MAARAPRNRYYRRSYLSEAKFRQVARLFALDLTATAAAELTGLTRKTVTAIYLRIRRRLAEASAREAPWTAGEVEVDEAYFGARRVRGRPGRGAGGKTPVVGLRKRGGRVYAEVVPDCSKAALQQVIRGRVPLASVLHSVLHTDAWGGYDGLVRKLPRQADSLKLDSAGVVGLGRKVSGGTSPRLSCGRSVL